MLQTLWRFGIDGETNGNALLSFGVAIEYHHTALFALSLSHSSEVETIGGKADMIVDANGELLQQCFLAGDAVACERNTKAFLRGER